MVIRASHLDLVSTAAAAVIALGGLACASEPATTITTVEPRILAQQGLAIALANNVLVSQLQIVFSLANGAPSPCTSVEGGGSVLAPVVKTVSSTVTEGQVVVFYDAACKRPYIKATATATTSSRTGAISVTEAASYLGLSGQMLGSLALAERATISASSLSVTGTGTFRPHDGAPPVSLGLACTIPSSATIPPFVCEGGIAQEFPKLKLSLASVTPLTLTLSPIKGGSYKVALAGKTSDMVTGAPGALSIEASGTHLVIAGKSNAYSSTQTKGSAAQFGLFPPTPTGWTTIDPAHNAAFSLAVESDTTRNSGAIVASIAPKHTEARLAVDQSGTGAIVYPDGSKASITSWLLAD